MKFRKSIYTFIAVLLIGIVLYFIYQINEYYYNAYFMDLQSNEVSKLGNKKYNIDYVEWSKESKHFLFVNEKVDYYIPPFKDEIVVFSVPELKNIKLHKLNSNTWEHRRVLASFVENEIIAINSYSNENYLYETYNLESMEKTVITKDKFIKYIDAINNGIAKLNDKYDVPSNVESDIKKVFNKDPYDILISNNGEKVIYRDMDYKVYLLDLITMERKFLFCGYNLNWSPRESKISYCIPTEEKVEDYDFENGYSNESVTTYIYDLSTNKSSKVIDFGAEVYFSYDDKYIVFYKGGYIGGRGAQ